MEKLVPCLSKIRMEFVYVPPLLASLPLYISCGEECVAVCIKAKLGAIVCLKHGHGLTYSIMSWLNTPQ